MDLVLSPVCSPAYALEYGLRSPADLHRAKLIEVPGLEGWKPWLAAAGMTWEPDQRIIRFDDPVLLQDAAASGLGVAIGDRILTGDQVRSGELVRPFDVECKLASPISIHVRERSSMHVELFVEWLRNQMEESRRVDTVSKP